MRLSGAVPDEISSFTALQGQLETDGPLDKQTLVGDAVKACCAALGRDHEEPEVQDMVSRCCHALRPAPARSMALTERYPTVCTDHVAKVQLVQHTGGPREHDRGRCQPIMLAGWLMTDRSAVRSAHSDAMCACCAGGGRAAESPAPDAELDEGGSWQGSRYHTPCTGHLLALLSD